MGKLKPEPTHLTSKKIPTALQSLFLSMVLAHFEVSFNFWAPTSFMSVSDF